MNQSLAGLLATALAAMAPDGTKPTINFAGAPRRNDTSAYFLKAIILPDGRRFSVIN